MGTSGTISFASQHYKAGVWLAGETVEVVCDGGLVHLNHRGVLIASHARRHQPDKQTAGLRRATRSRTQRPPKPTASTVSVTRKVDSCRARWRLCMARRHGDCAGALHALADAYRDRLASAV